MPHQTSYPTWVFDRPLSAGGLTKHASKRMGIRLMNPTERRLRAQIAAEESWARTPDRTARTAPARRAMYEKFERIVDPNGELTAAERAKRAENARTAHYRRMAYLSARARSRQEVSA